MNCQFYPSCSNFFSLAIAERGMLRGTIIGFDRIVRCNPAAVGYHFNNPSAQFYSDGRLIDQLNLENQTRVTNTSKLPIYFSIIPGLGRAYLDHPFDGIVSFSFVFLFSGTSYYFYKNGHNIPSSISGIFAILFWAADFYGTSQLLEIKQNGIKNN